ncbi:MAG TPA: MarR family transcriptional regulator [Microbacterium sp.]|nr:MarR family transcriptional regulator [Microbacterium sp.]
MLSIDMTDALTSSPGPALADDASRLRLAVMRFSRRLRAERAVDTMSDGQIAVLGWLRVKGAHTLGELAERERVSAPSMNRIVNCLEESGYVTRTPDGKDRRKVNIALSDAGRDVITETARLRDVWLESVLSEFTPTERAALAEAESLLSRIAER